MVILLKVSRWRIQSVINTSYTCLMKCLNDSLHFWLVGSFVLFLQRELLLWFYWAHQIYLVLRLSQKIHRLVILRVEHEGWLNPWRLKIIAHIEPRFSLWLLLDALKVVPTVLTLISHLIHSGPWLPHLLRLRPHKFIFHLNLHTIFSYFIIYVIYIFNHLKVEGNNSRRDRVERSVS